MEEENEGNTMRKISRWRKWLYGFIVGLLCLMVGWIVIHAANAVPMAKHLFVGKGQYLWILPGSLLLLMGWLWLSGKSRSWSEKKLKKAMILLSVGIFLLQLCYLYFVRVYVLYDNLLILDQAVEMQGTRQINPEFFKEYFQRYPHNAPIVIGLYWVLKIAGVFGVGSLHWVPCMVGLFSMDLGLLFGGLLLKKLATMRSVFLYVCLCFLNPWIYIWIPWYYTTVCSIPFLMGMVYFAVAAWKEEKTGKQIFYSVVFGVFAALGIRIRVTTAIVLIALLIWTCAGRVWEKKKVASILMPAALSMVTLFLVTGGVIRHYVPFDTEEKSLPPTHFVMMGMSGEGTYKAPDVAYTSGFVGREAKVDANLAQIKKRILDKGPLGMVKLVGQKLCVTWEDGSAGFQQEWMYSKEPSKAYLYLCGERNDGFLLYAQWFHVAMLLCVLTGSIRGMKKQKWDIWLLLRLILLGHMMFYILWEAQNRYSIGMLFILMLLAADGLEPWTGAKERKGQILHRVEAAVCLAVSIVLVGNVFLTADFSYRSFSVRNTYGVGEPLADLRGGEVVEQTFVTDQPFDHLYLPIQYYDPASGMGSCLVEIRDEAGTVRVSQEVSSEMVITGQNVLSFEKVCPQGEEMFTLRVAIRETGEGSGLFWKRYCAAIDFYPQGALWRNGEKQPGDLLLSIYEEKEYRGGER